MEFSDSAFEPFGEILLDMPVATQLSLKTPLVYRIMKTLMNSGCLPWIGSHRAELCLDEALGNAMTHGNKLDPSKKVHVLVFADDTRWGVIVEDEGIGFGPADLPDPKDPQFILRETGRGILLMSNYADELRYNSKGNRVLIIRHRQTEPETAEIEAAVEPEAVTLSASEPLIISQEGGVNVIEICVARLTDETGSVASNNLRASVASKKLVVLDFSHVEYISSVGLSTLVGVYKQIQSQKGRLILAAVQPPVKDILASAHLLQLLNTAPDRKSAIAELQKFA